MPGCTDAEACNYDESANVDNGSLNTWSLTSVVNADGRERLRLY